MLSPSKATTAKSRAAAPYGTPNHAQSRPPRSSSAAVTATNSSAGHSGTCAHGKLVALPSSANYCDVFMQSNGARLTQPIWTAVCRAKIESLPPCESGVALHVSRNNDGVASPSHNENPRNASGGAKPSVHNREHQPRQAEESKQQTTKKRDRSEHAPRLERHAPKTVAADVRRRTNGSIDPGTSASLRRRLQLEKLEAQHQEVISHLRRLQSTADWIESATTRIEQKLTDGDFAKLVADQVAAHMTADRSREQEDAVRLRSIIAWAERYGLTLETAEQEIVG